VKKKKHWRYKM